MAEWLLVAVPLLVAPVVLLLAFSGCSEILGIGPPYITEDYYGHDLRARTNLVAYWSLDDDAAAVVAADKAHDPSTFSGTYEGATKPAVVHPGIPGAQDGDVIRRGRAFNGVDKQFVRVPYALPLNPEATSGFSLEVWVNPDPNFPASGKDDGFPVVVSSYDGPDGAPTAGFELSLNRLTPDKSWQALLQVFPGRDVAKAGAKPASVVSGLGSGGQWKQLVIMVLPAKPGLVTVGLYVDGRDTWIADAKNQRLEVPYAPVRNAGRPLLLGARQQSAGPAYFFRGGLDEVSLYNPPLDAAAILNDFRDGTTYREYRYYPYGM